MKINYLTIGKILEFNKEDGIIKVEKEYGGDGLCEGFIFKSEENFYENPNLPCYVPEHSGDAVVEHTFGRDYTSDFYTKNDFLNITGGNEDEAIALFESVWWQHPETLWDEWDTDGETEVI